MFPGRVDQVDWRRAVELASRAPSVHNTQPWQFVVHHDTVDVIADRDRALPALDPTGRQRVLSCGAALEHLRLGLLAQQHSAVIETFPDPDSPDLLARVGIGAPATPDDVDAELIRAIPLRAMVRDAFAPDPIPADLVDLLTRDVTIDNVWAHAVTRPEDTIALMVLLQHADEAQQSDPAYLEELRLWRRDHPAPDGIPDAAVPSTTGRHAGYVQRDFDGDVGGDPPENPVDEKPLIVIVGTPNDSELDWLNAGRRLARLLLRAAGLGIVASPLNQVIDDPGPRQQLRSQLGMIGWPQMVLRMGYGQATPSTGRRSTEEILRTDPS